MNEWVDTRALIPRPSGRLSTEETASRLGVKKETVYAYVSRGVLARQKAVDGRASTFDADEVDRLRRQRAGGHPGRLEAPVTTSVTDVRDGYVAYRGTPIDELARTKVGFEQVASILWGIPSAQWTAPPELITAIAAATHRLGPSANLIDRLLAGTVMASTHDPFRHDRDPASATASVRHLVAATVDSLPPLKTVKMANNASIAERLWPRLTTAARTNARVLDQTLMLLADHGIASSTLAARIAASTRGGPHASIIAGLGALNGPLHGAAGQAVHHLLLDAEAHGVESAIADVLRTNGKVPGIGHFIHRTSDPRFEIMMRSLDESTLSPARIAVVHEVLDQTRERITAPHNIDFSLGSFTFAAGMAPDAGELIFALARIVGWIAHAIEEHEQAPLRFRPIGRYDALRPRPAPPII